MTNDNSVSKICIQASSPQTTRSLRAVPLLWFPLQQSFIPSRSSQPLTNPFCANRQPLPFLPDQFTTQQSFMYLLGIHCQLLCPVPCFFYAWSTSALGKPHHLLRPRAWSECAAHDQVSPSAAKQSPYFLSQPPHTFSENSFTPFLRSNLQSPLPLT